MVTWVEIQYQGKVIKFLSPRTYWYYCCGNKHDVSMYIKYVICKLIKHVLINSIPSPAEIVLTLDRILDRRTRRNSILYDIMLIIHTLFKSKRLYNGMGIPNVRHVIQIIKSLRKEIEKDGLNTVLDRYLRYENH